jgi:uncharacterized membrane protein
MAVAPASAATRRGYLDWLRGLAVLIMIEAHLLDSWTRFPDRETSIFAKSVILGGFGAPLFLFLAGVSVSLSAASKLRKSGDIPTAARAVVRRGAEIFGLAFLFRLQACIVSWGSWWSLLKVDILNIMGPSIMAAAALWGAFRSSRARAFAFIAATLLVTAVTPIVRVTPLLDGLPDPLEAYLRPKPGLTNFIFFPWMAFVFAGACCGVLIDEARTRISEQRLNIRFGVLGAMLAVGALGASYLPSPYPSSHFWSTSPSFFLLRVGILVTLLGVAYAWMRRPGGETKWSPLQQLGRTSLFVYWIHVELVYGLMVRPLHKTFSLPAAWFAVLWFGLLMLIASLLKERVVQWWRSRALIPGHAR